MDELQEQVAQDEFFAHIKAALQDEFRFLSS